MCSSRTADISCTTVSSSVATWRRLLCFSSYAALHQGLTLAHFKAQLEDLREHIAHVRAQLEDLRKPLLTLDLNFSTLPTI
jgi:hypothetical protein